MAIKYDDAPNFIGDYAKIPFDSEIKYGDCYFSAGYLRGCTDSVGRTPYSYDYSGEFVVYRKRTVSKLGNKFE